MTEQDWHALARVTRDVVPVWIARASRHLRAAPQQHAKHQTLALAKRLDGDNNEAATYAKDELARLRQRGLLEWAPVRKS
jgi:hypothetical protein